MAHFYIHCILTFSGLKHHVYGTCVSTDQLTRCSAFKTARFIFTVMKTPILKLEGRGVHIFQKSRSPLTILGARRVAGSNFHSEAPQILSADVHAEVVTSPRICPPLF